MSESAPLPQSPLSELAEINPPVSLSGLTPESEVSFIPMADASETGQWISRQSRRLKDVRSGYTSFHDGDVLFAKITPCMENGKGCQATPLVNGIGFGSTEFHVLRARKGHSQRYVYHWTRSEELRLKAESMMTGSAGQRRVPAEFFSKFAVFSPEGQEQYRIAEILDTLDEAIQKTEQLIAKLKQIKQGLLHDLLTRGIDENGQLRDPIAHPEQFKDSVLGRIPLEWDVPRIRDIAVYVGSGVTPRGGSEVYRSEGVLFLRSQNIHFDGLHLDDVAYIDSRTHEQMSRSEVFPHDVLINITGASIGRCCAVPEGIGPTNVNQHVCAIRTAEPRKEDAKYFASVLTSYIGQSQIDRLNAGGNREGLNYEQLRSFSVPWPRQDERKRIAEVISAHDKRLSDEEEYLQKLGLEKKGLMHDLLTGKVRVNINREQG